MNSQAVTRAHTSLAEADKSPLASAPEAGAATIRESVAKAMQNYLAHLDGQDATDVYEMVLAEVEEPLLQAIMRYTRKNQTRAAIMLGLNRGTLRKKLKQYNML